MTDLSGQYLGRYYLTERLGEGGMATVYKGYDTRLERDVAVKIIRSAAFPAEELDQVLKRFEREAKSLAKLSHPNIVKVYDYGEHDGSPYLVMEYLPGGTLKKIIGKPVPWQDALRLLIPIARGVAYAHQRGILHRDIKPANILITEEGEPMLSDFGIARLFEGGQTTALTGSGVAIGTPEYMAPEQWTGLTSPQSDLYSLGIVLYEMLTGRKPYMADTPAAILIKQATEPLPSPRKFVADLPEEMELLLVKTLAKESKNRYEDINAFIEALNNLRVNRTVVSPLIPEKDHIEETHKVSFPEPVIPPIQQTADWQDDKTVRAMETGRNAAPEKEEHERAEISKSEKAGSRVVRQAGRSESLSRYFSVLKPVINNFKPKPVGKGWGLYSLIIIVLFALLALSIPVLRRAFGEAHVSVVAPSPVVTPLVFSGNSGGEVTIYQYDGEKLTSLIPPSNGEKNWSSAIAASGNIYFTSDRDGKAEIYRLIDGRTERVTNTPGQYESWGPVLGNTGNIYFTSNRDGKAEIYRLIDGKLERVTNTPGQYESWGPALGVSGNIYFTSNRDGKAEIYRSIDGKIERMTNTPGQYESWEPAFGNSGNIYFTSNRDGKAEIYRLMDGKIERVTNTPGQYESWGPVVWENNVYFTSNRSYRNQIYVLTPQIIPISDITSWTKLGLGKLPQY